MNATAYIRGQPMFESLSQRTVIIGNSGAGKSALAESLAALIHVPVIDLDLLNWEGDGYGRKRDEDAARRMTLEVSAQPLWIIEGVYRWLAEVALPRASEAAANLLALKKVSVWRQGTFILSGGWATMADDDAAMAAVADACAAKLTGTWWR